MINHITDITGYIEAALKTAGIRFTGTIPEAIDTMGNLYPMGLIRLQNDTLINDQGGIIESELTLAVFIISQAGIAKLKTHADLIYAAIKAIINSGSLRQDICNIYYDAIDWHTTVDFLSKRIGSLDFVSAINFRIKYKQTRN